MNCPKCKAPMEKVTQQGIEVDRCTQCRGLWLEMGEREKLGTKPDAQTVDVGEAAEGARQNSVDRIQCPECQTPMIRMVDSKQPHIWYESCPVCYGVFFDAGEFRDYAEKTVLDFFRDWRVKERK